MVGRVGTPAFEPLRRYKVADSETWTQPTISGNRLFVKDVSTLTLWTIPVRCTVARLVAAAAAK